MKTFADSEVRGKGGFKAGKGEDGGIWRGREAGRGMGGGGDDVM